MFINPGTVFVPLTPCTSEAILRLHSVNNQPLSATTDDEAETNANIIAEQRTVWLNKQHNIDYIADLGTCIGASIPRDVDFDLAVELFTAHLRNGSYDTAPRYRIATQQVTHPIFGPGLVIIGAEQATDLTRYIDDLMRHGPVIDPATHNAHMPVLHAGTVFDAARGGVVVEPDTAEAWCEIFTTTMPTSSTAPNVRPAEYPSSSVVVIDTAPGNHAQFSPTAVFPGATAIQFWLDNRHSDVTQPSNTPQGNTAISPDLVDIPDHTVPGYSMDTAKPFDQLLGAILRSVAAQIEQQGEMHLDEAARDDRNATLATLTAAATMVEHQAQHVDDDITDTVLENLATLARRMESRSAALDPDDLADSADTSQQLEIPLDAVIDAAEDVDPVDAVDPYANFYGDDEIQEHSAAVSTQRQLNPAEVTLTEAATLAIVRIGQFIDRAEF